MKAVIFLGPTISVDEAQTILPEAVYLPPAGQADLLSAVTTYKPDVIGLIDGVFSQSLSVWHKEILYALEQGVRVYGASSMGALRAAETDIFGMVGVGKIYRMYKSSEFIDDDEVALVYSVDEGKYINLSVPMVNIRATLDHAAENGLIEAETARRLTTLVKAQFYPGRSFPFLLKSAAEIGLSAEKIEALREFLEKSFIDLKKQDAIELLQAIRDLPESMPPLEVDFQLTRSHLFEALYDRDRTVQRKGINLPLDAISSYTALHRPDFQTFNFNALNRTLVLVLAELLHIDVTERMIAAEARRFRIEHKLRTTQQYIAWLAEVDLSEAEFTELMKEQALIRRLQRWLLTKLHLKGNVKLLLDALRLENQYSRWADQAAVQEKIVNDHDLLSSTSEYSDLLIEQLLLQHLQETACRMSVPYSTWLEEAGFDNARHLWLELLRAKLARDLMKNTRGNSATSTSSDPGDGDGSQR